MPVGTIDREEEQLQAQRDEKLTGFGARWKAEKGENEIRVLPPRPGGKVKHTVGTHWNVWDRGIDKENGKNLNCPKASDKTAPCFLCSTAAELQDSKNPTDQKIGKALAVRYQHLYNILDIENIEAGPQVAPFGATVNKGIYRYLTSTRYPDITSLETGTNLIITKTEKNKKVDYTVEALREPSCVPDAILDLFDVEDPTDLTKVFAIATDAAMRAAWAGEDDEDKGPEPERLTSRRRREEEAAPAPRVARSARAAAPAVGATAAPLPEALDPDDEEGDDAYEEGDEGDELEDEPVPAALAPRASRVARVARAAAPQPTPRVRTVAPVQAPDNGVTDGSAPSVGRRLGAAAAARAAR